MTYRAPINDMLLSLNHGAGLLAAVNAGHYDGFDRRRIAAYFAITTGAFLRTAS